jgi:NADH-quinone oxidoreductase subunit F
MLERVVRGEATPMDLDIIASVQENIIGHCLCVLGDAMAMPVASMVKRWRGEFEEAIAKGRETAPTQLDVESPHEVPIALTGAGA